MTTRSIPFTRSLVTLGAIACFAAQPVLSNPSGPQGTAAEVLLTERFLTQQLEDEGASGAAWGAGRLTPGQGGGSGRLGSLHIRANETLVLDTNSQMFPVPGQLNSIMSNLEPGADYDPLNQNTWPGVNITQARQGFEFSELRIDDGGTLVLKGTRPGRVFVRGVLVHEGILDLTGGTPEPHLSNSGTGFTTFNNQNALDTAAGGAGAIAGPAGGAGGKGADRLDANGNVTWQFVGGMDNPGAQKNGTAGQGVGSQLNGTEGRGGEHYPPRFPQAFSSSHSSFTHLELSSVGAGALCRVAMVAGAGSGGAYALSGGMGLGLSPFSSTLPGLLPNDPPPTPGGQSAGLALELPGSPASPTNKRNLEFWAGHLRGGAGGGGGGASLYATSSNSVQGPGCGHVPNWGLFPLWDHSAAGGGGGGGALMIAAGRSMSVTGVVDCRGGDGGSAVTPGAPITGCTQSGTNPSGADPDCGDHAAPGGAGAGGAIRLQSQVIQLASAAGRLDVSGGAGGLGAGLSVGGEGSPGLVRLETTGFQNQASDAALFGPAVAPYLPGTPSFNVPFTSAPILSIGLWEDQTYRPESYSGSQSCWMRPETAASFNRLDFVADVPGAPTDLSQFGWNMDVIFDVAGVGERRFPYRGIPPVDPNDGYDEANYPSALLGGLDFATYFGMTLNHNEPSLATGSYVALRFQGVKSAQSISDYCDVDLTSSAVAVDSLTPFVGHPAQLNGFSPQPDMVRFAVVFDQQLANHDPAVAGRVRGITNLRIRAVPN